MPIIYISPEKAKMIHEQTVLHSGGGSYCILDEGRIESILCHVQNDDYYPTILDKLRFMFFAFCKFHCFEDGNKRIAITICARFLLENGYLAEATTFLRETENISYHVASGAIDESLLHDILKAIMDHTFESDDALALRIAAAIENDPVL